MMTTSRWLTFLKHHVCAGLPLGYMSGV